MFFITNIFHAIRQAVKFEVILIILNQLGLLYQKSSRNSMKSSLLLVSLSIIILVTGTLSQAEAFTEKIQVSAGSVKNKQVYLEKGDSVSYGFNVNGGKNDDIIFRLISPGGSTIKSTTVYSYHRTSFTVDYSGNYQFQFDNKFSYISKKYIDFDWTITKPTYGLSYSQSSGYSMDFGWLLLFLIIIGGAIGGGVAAAKRKKRKTKGDSVVKGDNSKPSSDKNETKPILKEKLVLNKPTYVLNETKPVLKPTTPSQKNCSHKDFWFGPDSMKICTDCGIVLGPMYVESEKPETVPAQQQLDAFLVEDKKVGSEVKKETIHNIEQTEKALGILKERLAKGEISVQEYQNIKKELS